MIVSRPGGRPGRRSERRGGFPARRRAAASSAVFASKGWHPAASSYRRTPSAKMSLRASTSRPSQLLGRHVARRADEGADLRQAALGRRTPAGSRRATPKSRMRGRPASSRTHVLGLEVAVDDAGRVRRGQRARELDAGVEQPRHRHRATLDLVAQRLALDGTPTRGTRARRSPRARRRWRCRGARAPPRPAPRAAAARGAARRATKAGASTLSATRRPRRVSFGEVDDPHPAAADLARHLVRTEAAGRLEDRRSSGSISPLGDRRRHVEEAARRRSCAASSDSTSARSAASPPHSRVEERRTVGRLALERRRGRDR